MGDAPCEVSGKYLLYVPPRLVCSSLDGSDAFPLLMEGGSRLVELMVLKSSEPTFVMLVVLPGVDLDSDDLF